MRMFPLWLEKKRLASQSWSPTSRGHKQVRQVVKTTEMRFDQEMELKLKEAGCQEEGGGVPGRCVRNRGRVLGFRGYLARPHLVLFFLSSACSWPEGWLARYSLPSHCWLPGAWFNLHAGFFLSLREQPSKPTIAYLGGLEEERIKEHWLIAGGVQSAATRGGLARVFHTSHYTELC